MKRFINLVCGITITCLLLSCGGDSCDNSPVQVAEESSSSEPEGSSSSKVVKSAEMSSSEDVKLTECSSSNKGAESSSSVKVAESSSLAKVDESSSSIKQQAESSSSNEIADSSSSEPTTSSNSVIESSSSIKQEMESCSSNEFLDSSSSEIMESSSSIVASSSSHIILGKCRTKTEDKCVYGELYDERDGKTYKTVVMGTQEWMAENLNYSDSVASPNLQGGSWCYNNDDLNCEKYGRLYHWTAAIDTSESDCVGGCSNIKTINRQGICPYGWHLPDTSDFSKLFTYVKRYSVDNYGYDLLATTETNGKNAFGFSLLYAGEAVNIGLSNPTRFIALGTSTNLWTSVPDGTNSSNAAYFLRNNVYITSDYRSSGNPIRCVKD